MKDKKYIFTEETKEVDGHVLHRIQAVRDFANVKAGDLGGWTESEKNLSHKGNCWVFGNAEICGNARIFWNARVFGNTIVCENAKICIWRLYKVDHLYEIDKANYFAIWNCDVHGSNSYCDLLLDLMAELNIDSGRYITIIPFAPFCIHPNPEN